MSTHETRQSQDPGTIRTLRHDDDRWWEDHDNLTELAGSLICSGCLLDAIDVLRYMECPWRYDPEWTMFQAAEHGTFTDIEPSLNLAYYEYLELQPGVRR